jgi:NADP-dependent 3-hydroxy acid dehydrogenase YdfG
MKIAITGHSKGLGKALYDALIKKGHTCYGFSRSNSYDITDQEDQKAIIHKAKDCDVFINNAWKDFAQEQLLDMIYDHWQTVEGKTIVLINSRTRFGAGRNRLYTQSKKQLHFRTTKIFNDNEKRCRIISISPGYIKTEMTKAVHDKYNMLTPEQCADMIIWAMDQPQGIEIGELSCWRTTID